MYVEKNKIFFAIIVIIVIYTAFVFWRSFRCIEYTNTELTTTRAELLEATDRLRRTEERNRELKNRLNKCTITVSDTANRLGELNSVFRENNNGLHSSIEQLQRIAKEVEVLEDRLRDIVDNSCSDSASADMEL